MAIFQTFHVFDDLKVFRMLLRYYLLCVGRCICKIVTKNNLRLTIISPTIEDSHLPQPSNWECNLGSLQSNSQTDMIQNWAASPESSCLLLIHTYVYDIANAGPNTKWKGFTSSLLFGSLSVLVFLASMRLSVHPLLASSSGSGKWYLRKNFCKCTLEKVSPET